MNLLKFLVTAKIATYASKGESGEVLLNDGAKELTYSEGVLHYCDRYYGTNPFIGKEIVRENDRIVWAMNYFGRATSKTITPDKVYEFLKSAMRQVKEDRPFRGPAYFKSEDFEYFDESRGDYTNFVGIEKIFHKENEIYRLYYHGGTMT